MTSQSRARPAHGWQATLVAAGVLAILSLPLGSSIQESDADPLVRGIIHHIRVHDGSVIDATYRTTCSDRHCAARIWASGFNYGWYSTHDDPADASFSFSTPVGGLSIPLSLEENTGSWGRVYGIHEEFTSEGDVRIGFLTTHGLTFDLTLTNAELVKTSATEDVNWYRLSDFPGISAKVFNPGFTVADLQWHTEKGSIGFFKNSVPAMPVVGYTRSGPDGTAQCHAGTFPIGVCSDAFMGPPGDYRMTIIAAANALNSYVAAWADLET